MPKKNWSAVQGGFPEQILSVSFLVMRCHELLLSGSLWPDEGCSVRMLQATRPDTAPCPLWTERTFLFVLEMLGEGAAVASSDAPGE